MKRRDFLMTAVTAAGLAAYPSLPTQAQQLTESVMTQSDPMKAAEYLSVLESIAHTPALYTFYSYMHPDSQAIVPRATIVGWYQNDFQPLGPQQAIATGVRYLDQWVWQVNGKTYSDVAEVSYSQAFGNGSVSHDVVRLYWSNDQWNWFFGRDRAWVEQQNHRFSLKDHTLQAGNAPFGFDSARNLEANLTPRLPEAIVDTHTGREFVLTEARPFNTAPDLLTSEYQFSWSSDHADDLVPIGYFEGGAVTPGLDDAAVLDALAFQFQNSPPIRFHGWNANPTSGLPWIHLGIYRNDMVGFVDSVFLVHNGRYIHSSMLNENRFELISAAIGGV